MSFNCTELTWCEKFTGTEPLEVSVQWKILSGVGHGPQKNFFPKQKKPIKY